MTSGLGRGVGKVADLGREGGIGPRTVTGVLSEGLRVEVEY